MNASKVIVFALALFALHANAAQPTRRTAQVPRLAQNARPTNATTLNTSEMEPQKRERSSFIRLAPVLGTTVSRLQMSQSDSGTYDSLIGFQGGGLALLGSGQLHFETGLLYAQRGASVKLLDLYKLNYRLNYIEMPALVRYSFMPQTRSNVFLRGGVVVASLQSSKIEIEKAPAGATVSDRTSDIVNPIDTRWVVGVGGNIRINPSIFIAIQGEFQKSLSTISKDGQGVYNESVGVSSGVVFPL